MRKSTFAKIPLTAQGNGQRQNTHEEMTAVIQLRCWLLEP
jgi:hypothetical protein